MKDNIILIGMPGCGKSTVGVVLAKNLGFRFLDSDLLIQEQEGMLLSEIIETKGFAGFRAIENQVHMKLYAEKTVIATGGSVVYGEEAMLHLKEIGKVVYIKLSCDEIKNRLGDLNERGVLIEKTQTIEDLYRERTVLYEKYADITIDAERKSIRELVYEIKSVSHP